MELRRDGTKMESLLDTELVLEELKNKLFEGLIYDLTSNKSIALFAAKRAKFEGWLKVRIVDILLNSAPKYSVVPESGFGELFPNQAFNKLFNEEEFKTIFPKREYNNNRKKTKNFDVYIKELELLLELKTVATDYKSELPEWANKKSSRPIKDNVLEVLTDIEVLKKINKNKAVLFIVYPLPENKQQDWEKNYLDAIKSGKMVSKDKKNGTGKVRHWELLASSNLKKLEQKEFKFSNQIRGVMYFGII